MKQLRNEQGYVLVLVLLLVVFILTLTAAFMRGSISNAKQEREVDTNHLSVVTAEMGVDFYRAIIVNAYEDSKVELNGIMKNAVQEITSQRNAMQSAEKTEQQIKEALLQIEKQKRLKVATTIQDRVGKQYSNTSAPELLMNNTHFSKTNIGWLEVNENVVLLQFNIEGKHSGKEAQLKSTMDFTIPRLLTDDGQLLVNQSDDWFNQSFTFIDKPTTSCSGNVTGETCYTNNSSFFKSANNSILYFTQNIELTNGSEGKNFQNSIVYSVGNAILPNMNSASNLTIHTKGSIHMKNGNSMENVTLISGDDFEVDNGGKNLRATNSRFHIKDNFKAEHFDLIYSKMYVGNEIILTKKSSLDRSQVVVGSNFVMKKQLDIKEGSSLLVVNNFDSPDTTSINTTSKMCVGENVDISKINIDSTSKLYVTSQARGKSPNPDRVEIVHKNQLKSICAEESTSSTNEVPWQAPKIDVTY